MCQVCMRAARATGDRLGLRGGGAVRCTVSGRSVAEHVMESVATCPRRRHGAVVRWFGIMWYGPPAPLRWLMFWWLTGPVPGCGCVKFLKDIWESFHAASTDQNAPRT